MTPAPTRSAPWPPPGDGECGPGQGRHANKTETLSRRVGGPGRCSFQFCSPRAMSYSHPAASAAPSADAVPHVTTDPRTIIEPPITHEKRTTARRRARCGLKPGPSLESREAELYPIHKRDLPRSGKRHRPLTCPWCDAGVFTSANAHECLCWYTSSPHRRW